MKFKFLSYGSNGFEANARVLCSNALSVGFDSGTVVTFEDIADSKFAHDNREMLSEATGGGFWLWKPYIIHEAVKALEDGEVLMYADAGRNSYYHFSSFPAPLAHCVSASSEGFLTGVAIPHLSRISEWTKRDCLKVMEADVPSIYERPAIQATWSIWRRTPKAVEFLRDWLKFCQDPRCITNAPNALGSDNLPGFVAHRFDQSISSILTYQHNAPYLDFSGTLVHRALKIRPNSALGNYFYKRAQNVADLLSGASPAILLREHLRLRKVSRR